MMPEANARVYNFLDTSSNSFDFISANMGPFTTHNQSVCSETEFIKYNIQHIKVKFPSSQVFSV